MLFRENGVRAKTPEDLALLVLGHPEATLIHYIHFGILQKLSCRLAPAWSISTRDLYVISNAGWGARCLTVGRGGGSAPAGVDEEVAR